MRFYRDWYRPEPDGGDRRRRRRSRRRRRHDQVSTFRALTNPPPERPRPAFDVPEKPGTRYAIVTDKETTATAVELSNLRPARNQGSVGGYRDIMLDQLFGAMLDARLDELSQRENPPFIRAAADRRLFPMPRTKDEAVLQALVSNDGVARGLDALVTELQRVARFGFTATELARAKQAMMAGYERVVTESPDRESASRADEYTRNFLQDEALPTIWQELAFHRRFVPGITLAEINALTTDWFPDQNRLVIVAAPEAAGVALPDQAQLAAVVKTAAAKKLEAYVDAGAGDALMDAPPARGSIVKTTARPEAGITEWTLSNGATVVLKPTTLKEDQILFRAFAPGGTSLASDADFIPARAADDVVPAAASGQFSAAMLDKLLTGKAVARHAVHRRDRAGHGRRQHAAGSRNDVPADLPAIHAAARRSDRVRRAGIAGQRAARQPAGEPGRRVQPDDRRRAEPEQPAAAARDAGDGGSVEPGEVAGVLQGALRGREQLHVRLRRQLHARDDQAAGRDLHRQPAGDAHEETWRDLGITPPTGVVEKTIEMGIAPKSRGGHRLLRAVRVRRRTPAGAAGDDAACCSRGCSTPSGRSSAAPTASRVDRTRRSFPSRNTACASSGRAIRRARRALVQRVFEEIEFVKATRYHAEQVGRIREALLREFEQNSQENGYFLNEIARRYEDGDGANVAAVSTCPTRSPR